MKIRLAKDSGHIHLSAYVNGKGPFDFTLDTGAGMTVISKALADQIDLEVYQSSKAKAIGVGGNPIPVKTATVSSLQLGKFTFHDKAIAIIDFSPITGAGCFTPGVIGHDILKDYILIIDYQTETVTLEKQLDPSAMGEKNVEWIPFQYVEGTHLMRVPVHLNGQGPFELILDTGASGTVITPSIANTLGITDDQPQRSEEQKIAQAQGCSQGVCVGPTGVATGFGATLHQLTVGSVTQENMDVGVIDLKLISPNGDEINYGVLGYPFLKSYTLVIDYPNTRFALIN
ncbi:MAG: aspartyl protease family protein [Promethearchaeota archaeon]